MPTELQCPRCGEKCFWEDNLYRPFCSERCKLIDFGAWANEDYTLPTQDAPQAEGDHHENQF